MKTIRTMRRAFVLIELLMIIAVIGILASILLPALARARETARRSSCMVNLSQIGMAMRMYAEEHERMLPWSGGENRADALLYLYSNYLPEFTTFMCPSDPNAGDFEEAADAQGNLLPISAKIEDMRSLRCSYDYFGAYTRGPLTLPHPASPIPKVPVMWDIAFTEDVTSFNHIPGGANVLWLDGSVAFVLTGELAGSNLPYRPEGISFLDPGQSLREIQEAQMEREGRRGRPRIPEPMSSEELAKQKAEQEAARKAAIEQLQSRGAMLQRAPEKKPGLAKRSWRWLKRYVFYTN